MPSNQVVILPRHKQAGEETKLSVLWWHGELPVTGDVLIIEVIHKRNGALKSLGCIVLPPFAVFTGNIHHWDWAARGRRF